LQVLESKEAVFYSCKGEAARMIGRYVRFAQRCKAEVQTGTAGGSAKIAPARWTG